MKTVIITLVIAVAVVIAAFVGFVYSGFFYVGADAPDYPVISWTARTTRAHSVASGASDIEPPANLDSPTLISMGASHYKEMCVQCHLAPGVESSELRMGLHPTPPKLAEHAEHLPAVRMFWILKHGVRMTGMPAWGESHDDEAIWALTAFIKNKLPTMTAAEFAAVVPEEEGDEGHEHGEHAHGHEADEQGQTDMHQEAAQR